MKTPAFHELTDIVFAMACLVILLIIGAAGVILVAAITGAIQ